MIAGMLSLTGSNQRTFGQKIHQVACGRRRRCSGDRAVFSCGEPASESFRAFVSSWKFTESRRKAYYLMAIHEQLPRIHKVELQQVSWTKATELAKVARRDGQGFDSATWLHKARELPKEEFNREVSKHLTGKGTEPWEILYFKAYKSQLPVIEQALETAGLMLGSDKSRGYCLEMICADFLAGVSLENGNQDALLPCLTRLVIGLPKPQRKQLLEEVQVTL
jgi:hypothetical protein